jgi:hypothetical protein
VFSVSARPTTTRRCRRIRSSASPTLYAWEEHDEKAGFRVITEYPADELLQVSATGAACFVVHRDVLEKIRAKPW